MLVELQYGDYGEDYPLVYMGIRVAHRRFVCQK